MLERLMKFLRRIFPRRKRGRVRFIDQPGVTHLIHITHVKGEPAPRDAPKSACLRNNIVEFKRPT